MTAGEDGAVRLTIENSVATVTLDRPDRRNALTVPMRTSIGDIFEQVAVDPQVRAVILTGAGDHFCVGGDVSRMDEAQANAIRERMRIGAHRMIKAIYGIEKPVIAAIEGVAAGIGWSLALACDFIWASDTARFSQVFRKVALAPDGGAAFFLARRVPVSLAKELCFSARIVEAEEGKTLGLVDRVVAPGRLQQEVAAAAAELASGPTFAFGLTKTLFAASLSPGLDGFLDAELMVQPQLRQTADHREGVAAFREKRAPKFQGR
ncbi:MAG: 2-(1,2-epoxy-1,2-dihydrophenyl)acetyl-CoA isomerase PaaG [Sphingomicrobium sp.]